MILLKASSDSSRTPISSFAPSDPTDLPALNGEECYSRNIPQNIAMKVFAGVIFGALFGTKA
jgi:hypothetical protein